MAARRQKRRVGRRAEAAGATSAGRRHDHGGCAAAVRGGNPEPLTVRRLGKELGADPTAIYRHFRDKDELVRAVLDRLVHERSRPWTRRRAGASG